MIGALLGLGVCLGTMSVLTQAVLQPILLDGVLCPFGEQRSLDLYGPAHDDYLRRVRRWV